MTWRTWTDAVDAWDAASIEEMQKTTILYFDDTDSRDAALTADIRREGMLTFNVLEGTYEAWDGAGWRVIDAIPIRALLSTTPTTNVSAASATTLATLTLPAPGTYSIRALVKVGSGTC
jgi:hypothetical protein